MDCPNERLMQAIHDNVKVLTLNKDVRVNSVCRNGMTHLGAVAQTGNLPLLKLLLDFHNYTSAPPNSKEKKKKPQYLQLDGNSPKRCKNIGYFVVVCDEENEFGDGPTPEGMEGLEWDMEVNDTNDFNMEEQPVDDENTNIYQWYAHILNRTSIMLESPERDLGRLDRHGQNLLHYAVHSGNIEMMEYLTENFGRELTYEQSDSTGYSCIHKAVISGNVETVKHLIKKGVNVDTVAGRHRQTPLHTAIKFGYHEIMRHLIASGCNINATDMDDRTPLNWAVRKSDPEAVKILCEAGCFVNSEERGEITALELAVSNGREDIFKMLLARGARILPSRYLLHKAVIQHNLDMIIALLEAGAPINAPNKNGYTPVMVACSRKNPLILKYLILAGADVNIQSRVDGLTALHLVNQDVRSGNAVCRLVDILVNNGADLNATSYQGSILHHAIVVDNNSSAIEVIRHGADVNLKEQKLCWDTLSMAHRYGNLQLCKAIVYAGFDFKNFTNNPEKLRKSPNDSIFDFVAYVKSQPLALKDLCRIVIRRKIGSDRLHSKIKKLPLPTLVHRFLCMEEFIWP
ncbi:uncharacterized protein LOC143202749 isoform X2 [Rhynchophorus ferrugineus]|uniref:SOCS box domain-containing protein n=1 Tax=Rhynchophorus ferrugineus TaxID=354439 RepID=A0A834HYQ6_RHYFE|nr:hypothetical protein GWI33_017685 [Rhynchophorus ferrugineus]